MTGEEEASGPRPSLRMLILALLVWSVLAFALPLAALTLNGVKIAAFPLGYWLTAFGCPLLLALLALWFQRHVGGGGGAEAIGASLSLSSAALGAAGMLGFAAAIAAIGFDGLSYSLGLVAGLALLSILVTPRFAVYPACSVTDFLEFRFGSCWPNRIAILAVAISSVFLLAANLRGAALVMQGLMAADYGTSLAVAVIALTVVWLGRSMLQARGPVGVTYAITLSGLAIFLIGQILHLGRPVLSDVFAGAFLADLFAVDQKLITTKFADFTSLRPMTSPFSRLSATNFAGIVLAFAFGVAVLPSFLWQNAAQGHSAPHNASRRAARAAFCVAVAVMVLPMMAALMRLGVETTLAGGIKTGAIPDTISQPAGLGWISVCGAYTDLAAACAKVPGQRGSLRLQDVALDGDAMLLAGPLIANGPSMVWLLPFWIAAFVVSMVSGQSLLTGLVGATRKTKGATGATTRQLEPQTVVLVVLTLLAALFVAMLGRQSIQQLASQGFALLASALFPAVLLGLYWRRMTSAGAITAMFVGFAIALLYIGGSSLLPIQFFDWSGLLSNASAAASRRYTDLQAAYAAAPDGDGKSAAYAVLLQHAIPLSNWFGLDKAAIVLVAVPAGFVSGLIASLLSKEPSGGG